jgi:hypothetical protein
VQVQHVVQSQPSARTSQTQQINMQQQQQQRRQYPQQQQQQFNSQQSHASERTGIRAMELPTQAQPFPVHFERRTKCSKACQAASSGDSTIGGHDAAVRR